MADVARRCGVSKGAVSMALNRSVEQSRLSASTHRKIVGVARELGYRPSWRGRALSSRKTHSIGLIYGQGVPYLTDAYENMARIMAEALWDRGYHLVFVPVMGEPRQWQEMIEDQRLDGCLVVPPMPEELPNTLLSTKTPAVLINTISAAPLPQLIPDDAMGMGLLLHHLHGLGHRRIAYLRSPVNPKERPHFSMRVREEAFEKWAGDNGLDGDCQILDCNPMELAELLKRGEIPATAVVSYKADHAINLMHALWRIGVRVPDEVSVATFDDSSILSRLTPPVTTVAVPIDEISRKAVALMIDALEGDKAPAPEKLMFAESVIARESTAAPK